MIIDFMSSTPRDDFVFFFILSSNPEVAHTDKLGKTGNSQDILQIHVSHQIKDGDHDKKLHVLLIGALRGDEPLGTEVLIRFARHLVKGEKSLVDNFNLES